MARIRQSHSVREFLLPHRFALAVFFLVIQTSLLRGFCGSGGFPRFLLNQRSGDDDPQLLNAVFTVAMLFSITLARND